MTTYLLPDTHDLMNNDFSEKNGRAVMNTYSATSPVKTMSRTELAASVAVSSPSKLSPPEQLKSISMPSTPSQTPQSPRPARASPVHKRPTRDGSPSSTRSCASRTPPASRRPGGRCKYETALTMAKRRVLYNVGSEKLEAAPEEAAKTLGAEEEARLTKDITQLYEQLVPTADGEMQRQQFIDKLEGLLKEQWPAQPIKVNVFGSTGNLLGTKDSDVDICITTTCREIEHVCSIADLLARNGMERVVCVSSAKVPIVKVWDPSLQVACDMNVNNPVALENTAMIRTYVNIDSRFRPLAMIVKHWAKRRMLNDAALGGTLSSYTWICLVLNFLQTRHPPILPSLQKQEGLQPNVLGGVNVAFDKDINKYRDFGAKNTSTLGQLLYQFFHYYGHELDFETSVMSVRLGEVISKKEKAWHLLQENRLCVEEPFNISRNLGNTADDTSMRGIHIELRRAFEHVAAGRFDDLCEQFVPEQNEPAPRHADAFVHQPTRAIIPQAPPQVQNTYQNGRAGRAGPKANRNSNRHNNGRRASNPAGRSSTHLRDLPFAMTPQELHLQAQHQQHLLHDQLFQQYQYLQMQEQELRLQLYRQRGLLAASGYAASNMSTADSADDLDSRGTSTGNLTRTPLTAPLYQNRFPPSSPHIGSGVISPGIITNPASPLLQTVLPDSRRITRRASLNPAVPGAMRAHSQPARIASTPHTLPHMHPAFETTSRVSDPRRGSASSAGQQGVPTAYMLTRGQTPATVYDAGRRPAEYVGYYLGQPPTSAGWSRSAGISPTPSNAGLAIHHTGLSPRMGSLNSRVSTMLQTPPLQPTIMSNASHVGHMTNGTLPPDDAHIAEPISIGAGPLIVDGSLSSPPRRQVHTDELNMTTRRRSSTPHAAPIKDDANISVTTSEDLAVNTPPSSEDLNSDIAGIRVVHNVNGHEIDHEPEATAKTPQSSQPVDMLSIQSPHPNGLAISDVVSDENSLPNFYKSNGSAQIPHIAQTVAPQHRAYGIPQNLMFPVNSSMGSVQAPSSNSISDKTAQWVMQKPKKKKNKSKNIKADVASSVVNAAGGEVLPDNESDRKGG